MRDSILEACIQGWLDQNGPRTNTDLPMFKLVWCDDEFEVREGVISYYFGNVKISEGTEITRMRKYAWMRERYVFEMWMGPEVTRTKEIPDTAHGSYEPIYVFEDKKGNALPLKLEVIQILIQTALRPKSSSMAIKSRIQAQEEEKERREDATDLDRIDTSAMQSLFHFGEAGIVPVQYDILPPNLRNK